MPKRDTVFINYEKTVQLIKEKYRNNTIFCEAINKAMGTERTTKWVSEWKRNSNLPSPEEAVYICVLLQTTPDEILLHQGETEEQTAKCQKDIALVRDLIDQQGAKKAPTEISERELDDPDVQEIYKFARTCNDTERENLKKYIAFLESLRTGD